MLESANVLLCDCISSVWGGMSNVKVVLFLVTVDLCFY